MYVFFSNCKSFPLSRSDLSLRGALRLLVGFSSERNDLFPSCMRIPWFLGLDLGSEIRASFLFDVEVKQRMV